MSFASSSVQPKTLFWFWFDTESETKNGQNHISNGSFLKGRYLVTDHKRTTKTQLFLDYFCRSVFNFKLYKSHICKKVGKHEKKI